MNPDALRNMVAGFLTDQCEIRSRGAAATFNTTTGVTARHTGDIVYSGPCRIMLIRGGEVVEAGEALVPLGALDVRLPWDTVGIEIDQIITVTDSTDPQLVGRRLRVTDVQGITDNPYRRLHAEDTRTVAEWAEGGS